MGAGVVKVGAEVKVGPAEERVAGVREGVLRGGSIRSRRRWRSWSCWRRKSRICRSTNRRGIVRGLVGILGVGV